MVKLLTSLSILTALFGIPSQVLVAAQDQVIAACGRKDYVGGSVVAKLTDGCLDDPEVFFDKSSKLAVRCCSDVDLGKAWRQAKGCAVWAGTIYIGGKRCPGKMNYAEAEAFCANAGGRLCTSAEMTNDCTAGTGCRYDTEMVWTSSTENFLIKDPVVITCGATGFVGGQTKAKGTVGCLTEHQVLADPKTNLKLNVRCCSDTYLPWPWKRNDWCSAWAATQFAGYECAPKMTYDEAQDYCAAKGGRICTTEEIYKDCTVGTGCGYDSEQVWTSSSEIYIRPSVTACGRSDMVGGYNIAKGTAGCADELEVPLRPTYHNEAAVRCCSDVDLGFPWRKNNGCPVWGASMNLNGKRCSGKMDFTDAEAYCAAAGARLCTAEEVVKDCVAGTGCRYDTEMIWTSSEYVYATPTEPVVVACGSSSFVGSEKNGQAVAGTQGCLNEHQKLIHPAFLRSVRCCSDYFLGRTWKLNDGCSVYTISAKNTDGGCAGKMDQIQAQEYCASIGGRLCTAREIVTDCTIETGCGLDTEMVWTSSDTIY